MTDSTHLDKPGFKYEPTLTLGNVLSAISGLVTLGILYGVQTHINSTTQRDIDENIRVSREHSQQIDHLKDNDATQRETTSLIKQELTNLKDIALEIRSEQKEVKRELQK